MKKYFYYSVIVMLITISNAFAARSAVHNVTNFNTEDLTYSFDIYSKSTGTTAIFVGHTSFYIDFNSTAMSTPVFTYINPLYSGDPTGSTSDYKTMTVQIVQNKIAVTIFFTGNGSGTGTQLSSAEPLGDLICSISLTITNPNATSNIGWDQVNSTMLTTGFLAVASSYIGSDASPLPIELDSFTAFHTGSDVHLKWITKTEVQNSGFELERKSDNSEWHKIAFIKGAGNSNIPKEYSFRDLPFGNKEFQYRLKQIDVDGGSTYSPIVEVVLVTPTQLKLVQNYPNPFNPSTSIRFDLPNDSHVNLKVYNMIGQQVAELINEDYTAGYHSVTFNGTNLSSGTYLYRLEAGNFSMVKKMIFIK